MRSRVIERLSEEFELSIQQVEDIIAQRERGATIPYIATFRQDLSGGMDENAILKFEDRYRFLIDLEKKKAAYIHTIQSQDELTDDLQQKIEATFSRWELDDVYFKFRPQKVCENHVEDLVRPLAQAVYEQSIETGTLEELASTYIDEKAGIPTAEDALKAAGCILSVWITENPDVRGTVRDHLLEHGNLVTSKNEQFRKKKKQHKFEMFFDHSEAVSDISAPRFQTIKKGVDDNILFANIKIENDDLEELVNKIIIKSPDSIGVEFLNELISSTLKNSLIPTVEKEVWFILKERADQDTLDSLSLNLKQLLLSPPFGSRKVLGIDPGYKAGCKIAVVDGDGSVLEVATIYPHDPKKDQDEARKGLMALIEKHAIEAVVIGDGTASRETDHFVKEILRQAKMNSVISMVISEVGANVYASSKLAKTELADIEVASRGAVSIARRFQDPLRELVKIDPAILTIGQFFHEINQTHLKKHLKNTLKWCVNYVGVDLNNAPQYHLKYVSGISDVLARRIVKYREENGPFKTKRDLMKVSHFGRKAFEQSVGFLRIPESEFILDRTGIHPRFSKLIDMITSRFEKKLEDVLGDGEFWNSVPFEEFEYKDLTAETITFLKNELIQCGKDCREAFKIIPINENINTIEDIKPGMTLKGRVSNITDFGAFVDIGVHQDGLIHISEISNDYVKEAQKVLSIGDIIKVQVLKIDLQRNRISLSMKALEQSSVYSVARKKKKKKKKKKRVIVQQQREEKTVHSLEDLVKHFERLG